MRREPCPSTSTPGPKIGGRATNLWCAWLAWCRHRVVIPTWDRTLPTVIACLDSSMRAWGGAPTYWLTDNERTVTIDHVAGIAVRHPQVVAAGKHYGVTIATCVPADPESKGGSEATVRIAKADLVPTETNLRDDYRSWAELVEACEAFMAKVNGREHRITRRAPDEMLVEEQQRLHRLPDVAYTAAFGETRKVSWSSTISYGGVTYSVPHTLVDDQVWVRVDGDEVVAVHVSRAGAVEVARHRRSTPGTPVIDDAHYPRPARRAIGPPTEGDQHGGGRVPGHRRGRPHVAGRSGRCRHEPGEGEDGRGRHPRSTARNRPHRLGPRARGDVLPVRRRRPGERAPMSGPAAMRRLLVGTG